MIYGYELVKYFSEEEDKKKEDRKEKIKNIAKGTGVALGALATDPLLHYLTLPDQVYNKLYKNANELGMKFIPGMVAAGLAQNNRNKLKDKELESEGKEKQSKFKKDIKIAGSVIGNAAANTAAVYLTYKALDHLPGKLSKTVAVAAQAAPTAISAVNALRLKNKLNKLEKKEKEGESQK